LSEVLRPTTAGRQLDVSAGGEAGIDWANVGSPTTAVNLSATNIDVDQVVASVSGTIGGLSAAALKDFFDTDSTTTYASAVAGSVVKEIADNAGGSALTAAAIADAVWDEAQADHVAVGSFGVTASEIADILVDTAEIGAAGAGLTNINLPNQTMDIVGNITGNLSGSVGSVTGLTVAHIDAAISTRATQTSVDDLPTNAELATALGTADDAVLAAVATVDGNVDAIKAKTDSLTFTVAGQVDANVQYVNDVQVTGVGSEADPWGP